MKFNTSNVKCADGGKIRISKKVYDMIDKWIGEVVHRIYYENVVYRYNIIKTEYKKTQKANRPNRIMSLFQKPKKKPPLKESSDLDVLLGAVNHQKPPMTEEQIISKLEAYLDDVHDTMADIMECYRETFKQYIMNQNFCLVSDDVQKIGAACLFLSASYNIEDLDVVAVSIKNLVHYSDNAFTDDELRQQIAKIGNALSWHICPFQGRRDMNISNAEHIKKILSICEDIPDEIAEFDDLILQYDSAQNVYKCFLADEYEGEYY